MLRYERRFIALFLPVALVGIFALSTSAIAQKKVVVVDRSFTPPNLSLAADPQVITVCEGAGPAIVQLNARATSDNPIRYRWTTSGGRITGDGATVSWDLSGLQPGYYKAYVDIDTGSGDELCQAFSSTAVLVNKCPPPPPVCPNVSIICPDKAELGQPLTFSSNVTGGSPDVTPIYNWTVSAGRIIEGQGTPTIRVDTTGLAGQAVTATLSMGGYTLDCSASCSVQLPVPLECRKFDEFPTLSYNDEKARLDTYAIELQNDPTSTAYVIVYPGQRGRPGAVERQTKRIVDYLVNSRGIDASRIITLVGPSRDSLLVELWLCPQGAKPPTVLR
ncbi:MAG TPA: hypothetical protein VJU86_19375 [Pyrinomonadaceae bacterium]|nr:hypothetical protein [Pyrinomonadaceae bacterium]